MRKAINAEALADLRQTAKKLAQLPENAKLYIAGFVEGAASAAEQARNGENRDGA